MPPDFAADVAARHPRGAPRESAIRDAALELLVEVGYDRMSMDAVASRAHASKATIYRRWPGKRELVLDAIRCRAAHAMVPPDTGQLRGDIIATMRAMAQGIGAQDAALVAGVLREMRCTPELADQMRTQVIEDKRDVSRTIVRRAVARGELGRDADADLLHEVAPALMFFRLLICGQPADDAFLAHVTDDVLIPLLARDRQRPIRQESQ